MKSPGGRRQHRHVDYRIIFLKPIIRGPKAHAHAERVAEIAARLADDEAGEGEPDG